MGGDVDVQGEVRRAAGTLLWGSALVVVDLRVNDVDLLNDVIGMLVVIAGLTCLERATHGSARRTFELGICLGALGVFLASADTAYSFGRSGAPTLLSTSSLALEILLALVLASALRLFAIERGDDELRSTWDTTFWLVLLLSAVPWTLSTIVRLFVGPLSVSVTSPLAITATLALIAIALMPVIHLFVSLTRTRRWEPGEERINGGLHI